MLSRTRVTKRRRVKKYIKKNHQKTKKNKYSKTRRNKKYVGGGDWINNNDLPKEDICPICHDEFSKTPEQAVYKTDCSHSFHNDCLNNVCNAAERNNATPVCPLCRANLINAKSDQCTDVWAFKNKALDEESLHNPGVREIYENQPN